MFTLKIGGNATTKKTVQDQQRTASTIAANNSNLEHDQLTCDMLSEVINMANERVNKGKGNQQQRTASITSRKVDEVGQLKYLLSRTDQSRFN